jgi:hypothetical protein
MQKWEYLRLEVRWKKPTFGEGYWLTMFHGKEVQGWSEVWELINDLGAQGWELVGVLSIDTGGGASIGYTMTGAEYYFKRRLPETAAGIE